ncbi:MULTISPECIES: DUF4396 domain-containing protein [Bradyrhizobium]|uniref:DUF4396 domain-containing protein n=1 Tax=Bradyrhizobium TaxID=374 RepID=UPI0004ADB66E|nr:MULTISPECIES: DUF4396 domain-containing protein [unclassified Bradyrhizobium]MDA9420699.1 membrane protein [Bradyrhizobium sp. CCBAU 53380]
MPPIWVHDLALACLAVGIACAIVIAVDLVRHPQRMWIMNIVWPVNGLFGSVLTLWLYYRFGRLAADRSKRSNTKEKTPFPVMVAKGAMHCGAGCTLGDIVAEGLALAFPVIAFWAGWKTLFSEKMFAIWVIDYLFAFVLGVAFQYFTIKPMRELSPAEGIVQAVKADTLSLTAWQVGMYGFMAIAQFAIFRNAFGVRLEPSMPEFWFMMQIAMIAGFFTSYPVNWWLIKAGVKERM